MHQYDPKYVMHHQQQHFDQLNERPTTESFVTVSQLMVPDSNHKKGAHYIKESS
jgi:hypothetical protein